ncbi:MAG: ABC transporter ATP-binding protein [Lachnospiraceae bacterium]|nr:ABC transporter ATP-binding protein [Lachnospiraceae bacterium]MBR6896646.1 ABC transporter ATP-binding protein [Lachnospiraceae bacterium]
MVIVENLVKTYNKGKKNEFQALNDISLTVDDGEMVAIVGKSGAGKSTLLHIIGAIDNYDGGSCKIDGIELSELSESKLADIRNRKVGIVMQDFALIEDYTVEENISLPLRFSGFGRHEINLKVKSAMEAAGIEDLSGKEVGLLSGGQKQRTAIARAIVNDPSILLADEPTGALDSVTGAQIMELFKRLNLSGRTVIIITHDAQIASACSRQILLEDGRIMQQEV